MVDEFRSGLDRNDPRFRLADATRLIIDELASSTADTTAFLAARDLVEQAASVLAQRGHGRTYGSPAEASLAEFSEMSFVDYSPIIGNLNPLAPPIRMSVSEPAPAVPAHESDAAGAGLGELAAEVVGSVVFGGAYEGPPGCVHGGFIAAGFDEVLGVTQARAGRPGMTARLTISYRTPTPLHQPLRFTGRIERIDGRKIFTTAELVVEATGLLCAEAEGLFVSVEPEVFAQMLSQRQIR